MGCIGLGGVEANAPRFRRGSDALDWVTCVVRQEENGFAIFTDKLFLACPEVLVVSTMWSACVSKTPSKDPTLYQIH